MSVSRELKRQVRRYEPCLPRSSKVPPPGPGWIREIKHDGFRILAELDHGGVKLITRGSQTYPQPAFTLQARGHFLQPALRRGGGDRPMENEERLIALGWRLEALEYRDRAAENLKLAEDAQTSDVRERYRKIADHYLDLAEEKERLARSKETGQ